MKEHDATETAYRNGYADGKPKWISVKDRLPDNEQWVLCFMDNNYFEKFRLFQWSYIYWQWYDGMLWYDEKYVTHWMPLPEEPEENEP